MGDLIEFPKQHEETDPAIELIVAELGPLEEWHQKHCRAIKRREELRKKLQEAINRATEPGQPVSLVVGKYTVTAGPRAWERTLDLGKVYKAIGAPTFRRIATITQAALETVLPKPKQIELGLYTERRVGPRSLEIFPTVPPSRGKERRAA